MVMRHGRAIATCHLWLFTFNLDEKFSSSVTPVAFQMLNSHIWLNDYLSDSTDREHFQHYRKFYWIALFYNVKLLRTNTL